MSVTKLLYARIQLVNAATSNTDPTFGVEMLGGLVYAWKIDGTNGAVFTEVERITSAIPATGRIVITGPNKITCDNLIVSCP